MRALHRDDHIQRNVVGTTFTYLSHANDASGRHTLDPPG